MVGELVSYLLSWFLVSWLVRLLLSWLVCLSVGDLEGQKPPKSRT